MKHLFAVALLFIGNSAFAGVNPAHRAILCTGLNLNEEIHHEFSVDKQSNGDKLYWMINDPYSNASYSQDVVSRTLDKNILSINFAKGGSAEKFLININNGFSKILFEGRVIVTICASSAVEIDDSHEFAKANKLPEVPEKWLEVREGYPY